jgi:23S rRNA pseudouridine955/2504/2580 synthase
MIEIAIDKLTSGQKAEKFVRKYLSEAPLGYIYKAFRKKDIKVNGHWIHKDYVLREGEILRIYVTPQQLEDFKKPREATKRPFPFPILYEDANVLIVDKPSGILVYGDATEKRNTLAKKVLDYLYFKGEFDPENPAFVPSPAHRLDRNTSGIVVFGKTAQGLSALTDLFKDRKELEKGYTALVIGKLTGEGEVSAPLRKNEESGLVSICPVEQGGKSALTKYKVIENFAFASLVELVLVTGRTHQIRVHMASIKHPLVGDGKYGDFEANKLYKTKFGYDHQFLHASRISFGKLSGVLASLSGKTFVSPLPEEEAAIIASLKQSSTI